MKRLVTLISHAVMHILDPYFCTSSVNFLQEWSYIPVGGSLPNTDQKNLAFGAAASMVHPATGTIKIKLL